MVLIISNLHLCIVMAFDGWMLRSFQRDWLRRDFNVIGFGLIGWLAPSSIPAINGKSLTGLFFDSIGAELAHFPTPPALTSQFWLVTTRRLLIIFSFIPYSCSLNYPLYANHHHHHIIITIIARSEVGNAVIS